MRHWLGSGTRPHRRAFGAAYACGAVIRLEPALALQAFEALGGTLAAALSAAFTVGLAACLLGLAASALLPNTSPTRGAPAPAGRPGVAESI